MLGRRLEHPALEAVGADEVREEHVRQREREPGEDDELEPAAPPRGVLAAVALEQALDRAEHELEVDRLRAAPAAPHAPEQRGDEEHGDHDGDAEQREQEAVGRAEHAAEQRDLARHEIDEHGRATADAEPRQEDEDGDQRIRDPPPVSPEPAPRELRMKEVARAVAVHRRQHFRRRQVLGHFLAPSGSNAPTG